MGKCSEIRSRQLNDFVALNNSARQQLLEHSQAMVLKKGSLIFEEAQPLNKLYCIKKGACKFSKVDNDGHERILRFLGEGEIMGKRSILSNQGAMVSAVALTDIELCCLSKDHILQHLEQNVQFCRDFLNALIEDANINERTRMIFCVHKGIQQRLVELLLYLSDKYGLDAQGRLRLRLKREDMAAVLGTSQEYVINLLNRFKRKKLIAIVKSEVYIPSTKKLRAFSNKT